MARTASLKPDHAAVKQYYATLETFSAQNVEHEGATETAFQRLLADVAKSKGWTLIPKLKLQAGGKTLYPDGTLRDQFNLPRGYWEAKDTNDDLNVEIRKKIEKGYPRDNIIYEDTRQAVLIQGGQERQRYDLTKPQELVNLLTDFFAYTEPDIEGFERAVQEFKEQVPNLAKGLNDKLKAAHKENKPFQKAFDGFFTLCQETLNPNISRDAVDEMLVQHLLTERLIRKVFDNPEFTRRNVIAAEVEKVIEALVSHSFNRDDFLKSLDRFYRAIEEAARHLEDFADKQHFLNTVYERFFQGYSVKVADTHGIVYTPQAIVDFMCASVEEVLKTEFNLSLGSPGVNILDPCTGTGNFIVNLLRRIPKKDLPRVYREQLFANEVMLLPYYIAALNIEHAYFELTGNYEPFEGLCFVDTLELAEQAGVFHFMTEKNAERVERQKQTPITVVIGNPPYNVGQLNENDNNKNRKYTVIDERIKGTYAKDSAATSVSKLNDPYVKFFRWATDRLEGRDGIICYVSNNSFVDQIAFDGMRKHLLQDFTHVYHLHLEGNVRQNPKLAGTIYNVFGIQVGVGITVAVRRRENSKPSRDRKGAVVASEKPLANARGSDRLFFFRIDQNHRREKKLEWLSEHGSIDKVSWRRIAPDLRFTWLIPEYATEFADFLAVGGRESKASRQQDTESIFKLYSIGVNSNRDSWVYNNDRGCLEQNVRQIIETYNSEIDRWKRAKKPKDIDDFVINDEKRIKWSSRLKETFARELYAEFDPQRIRSALYRPFAKRYLYFDSIMNHRQGLLPQVLPRASCEKENLIILVTGPGSEKPFMNLVARVLPDLHLVGAGAGTQCFPFYVYNEDGSNRRENITDWALKQFREHYGKLPLADARGSDVQGSDRKILSEPRASASGVAATPLPHGRGSEAARGAAPALHSDALAYFITFHTYGTWLHGRAEGSVDPHHNLPGTPVLAPDEEREQAEFRRLKTPPVVLDAKARGVVERTVGEVCAHRGWTLHALHVRTNHVHVVVTGAVKPEKVMNDFKAYATRRLVENGCVPAKAKVWARHGSTLYLWTEDAVADKCRYVVEGQGANLPREEGSSSEPRALASGVAATPLPHGRGSDTTISSDTTRAISKWDIFYYVYGLLHHPGYRTKFADNLKRELPRIPFAPDFKAFVTAGEHLARLHLDYEKLEPHPLQFVETPDLPLSYKVEDKMRLSKDKTSLRVNPSLTLAGIPPEVFGYRLGNRSALDWVIDQYQVSEDKRSGIRSDPNRPDDPEYILRLVGQVIHVSLETVRIVNGLPEQYAE